jgi:predicted hydrocarbon binding protein
MRFIKITRDELAKIRILYESLMGHASHGLFCREGLAIGEEFSTAAIYSGEEYFSTIKKLLKYRGWVEDIDFSEDIVIVKGSAEVSKGSEVETCHKLRGILQRVLEGYHGKKVRCTELECESTDGEQCAFSIEFIDGI